MTEVLSSINEATAILSDSSKGIAFSGAGVSAESEIATFRDPGGLWDQMDPSEVGTAEGLLHAVVHKIDLLLPVFRDLLDIFEKAELNPGHKALADLEKMGVVSTVITQNVDNLHREAGNTDVIEMHGNLFRLKCLYCGIRQIVERKTFVRDLRQRLKALPNYTPESLLELAPVCDACGSFMRPDVVLFGEAVQDIQRSFEVAAGCDAMLVLGTSGTVFPAALLPVEAKKAGAKVIVINPTEDPFKGISDIYIPLKTGEALPQIANFLASRA